MISKRDLLLTTDISYGQLYRWKREGLIPDEWFRKVSVSTGQETFFDETLIIPRIKQILELKDNYSLEELKNLLNPSKGEKIYFSNELKRIIDEETLKIVGKEISKGISFNQLILLYASSLIRSKFKDNDYLLKLCKAIIYLENIDFEDAVIYIYRIKDSYSINVVHKPIYTYGTLPLWEIELTEVKMKLLKKLKGE